MTVPTTDTQVQDKSNEKELNFRKLEQKYQREIEQERAARIEAEKIAQEATQKRQVQHVEEDEDEDDQPYIDKKRLHKTMNKFGQNTQSEIQKAMEMAKQHAKEELKQEMWMEQNPDFEDVLSNHAEKFAQKCPKLADTILRMPNNFDRQKLVYQNIKEMGIDKPEQKQSSIQDKIDSNRKSPFYQPSGIGAAPYNGTGGDYSQNGQKTAYEKMQALKKQLRI